MAKTKTRWLTRCRNRAAAGPTIYVMDIGGIQMLVPRRALLLDLRVSETQQMVRALAANYRERHQL